MAYDKVIDSVQLETAITATADAIREKLGITNQLEWRDNYGFAKDVGAIGTDPNLQDKTITENGTYTADEGYDGLGTVTVEVAVMPGNLQVGTMLLSAYIDAQNKFPYLNITVETIVYDTLIVSPDKLFVASDDKYFLLADGAHTTDSTGAEIDQFIADSRREG